MICTSIQNRNLEGIFALLDGGAVEMAEIRLDRCPLSEEDIEALFSGTDVPLVATCRIAEMGASGTGYPGSRGQNDAAAAAEARLLAAIRAGAAYVDLEIEAPALTAKHVRDACRECGTLLIRSSHDFRGTPSVVALQSTLDRCLHFGADIVKIVTTAFAPSDTVHVLSLYNRDGIDPSRLIAFAMGNAGRGSRLECLRLGAPFTYAALSDGEATASGQWTTAEMAARLYAPQANASDFARENADNAAPQAKGGVSARGCAESAAPQANDGAPARGRAGGHWRVEEPIAMPSSKSFAQRAIVAAALAEGTSRLSGYSPCGDNESALAAVRALGAEVAFDGDKTLVIKGIGATPGCLPPEMAVHTGESGFLTRLMIPLLAALGSGPVRVTGEKTLLNRPLSGAHDIMAAFGVRLYPEGEPSRRKEDCCLPLTVRGPLLPGRADVNGKGGSQLISGLLAALPLCAEKSVVYVHDPKSIPYLFITLDVLSKFGIRIGSEMEGDAAFMESQDWALCSGITFRVKPGQRYQAADFRIEGDWSGAAPFLVAGAVFGDLSVSGLDTASLQADLSMIDILTEAGASLSQLEGDTPTTGVIHVQKAPLRPFDADLNNCPDLFPAVAVLAAFCPGASRLLGVNRLTHKETDRAAAIRDMLTQMGVPVRIDDDEMTIEGLSLTQRLLTGRLLKGGRFTSHGDHRMVMALRVAELGADAPVEIDDEACVAKSYPGFHRAWAAVTAAAGRPGASGINRETEAGNPA